MNFKNFFNKKNFTILSLLSMEALVFTKAFSAEKDLYDFLWLDPDKKVYVLQNKIHKKDFTLYGNIGLGTGLSSTFTDTNLLHTNLGFYFTEEWSIEGIYTKYSNKNNEAFINLENLNGSVPFIRKTLSNYGLLLKWSPFYGKINTFNKIFYFDWAFGLGLGKISTESNSETVSDPTLKNTYRAESYSSIIGKSEFTIHASKNLHFSMGLIMNNFKAKGPILTTKPTDDKLRSNFDGILTVGFSF